MVYFSNCCVFYLAIFSLLLILRVSAKLECDPKVNIKKPDPDNPSSYLYCNFEGIITKKNCPEGKKFDNSTLDCVLINKELAQDDPILQPQFQAPDDICGTGVPLTRLSAPVACNPSISSCPDGYVCTMYTRTGTSYCCQNPSNPDEDESLCPGKQVTYYEPATGKPKTCVLAAPGSCPTGFACNLVGATTTRCCGKDFGCPFNSAGFVSSSTGVHIPCQIGDKRTCPEGFVCSKSTLFNSGICCSNTEVANSDDVCFGEKPLNQPNPCSANHPCPAGYTCRNGRCCPSSDWCPAGAPLAGISSCSAQEPCPNNYQCVINNGQQFCCPAPEHICGQPKNTGSSCDTPQLTVTRYYFDTSTGSCRSFQYSQCGGNANNFDTLEQCEGFCLVSQCPQGIGYRTGASNAVCSPLSPTTCPPQYSCMQPLYGVNHICCSNEELSCKESVSAGTACFGTFLTMQRFHYNTETGKCEAFQFYGCHGSANNYLTKQECEATCQLNLKHVCNGAAPLTDPNGHIQRCGDNTPCPSGYTCNDKGYCCPSSELACSSPKIAGSKCTTTRQDTYWYYDSESESCAPFTYHGCGGAPNRFADKASCEKLCHNRVGTCPTGMSSNTNDIQECTLNVAGTCPEGMSCVKSTTGSPICCASPAECPNGRQAYIIPGSDSNVACNPGDDICPANYECVQSSTVPGFYMCCSEAARRASLPKPSKTFSSRAPKCPLGLPTNGQRCIVNGIGTCMDGYTCLGFGKNGICCKAQPKCPKMHRPYFIARKQVLICSDDQAGCPSGSNCLESNLEDIEICCIPKQRSSSLIASIPKCRGDMLPFFDLGAREPKECRPEALVNECPDDYECGLASDDMYYCCPSWERCPAGATAFYMEGTRKPLGCNLVANNCPEGYSCEGPQDRAICCRTQASQAHCPMGRSPFLYARRPLVCPPGSTKCPRGYDCIPSTVPNLHMCCSTSMEQGEATPDCVNGVAYMEPMSSRPRFCSPQHVNTCPPGYFCQRSTMNDKNICCTSGAIDNRFEGYCPPGQIPYTHVNTIEPSTCHMVLNPCPNTAPYQCIYSAEKQNSYCCAPIDTAIKMAFHRMKGQNQLGHNQVMMTSVVDPNFTKNMSPNGNTPSDLGQDSNSDFPPDAPPSGCPPESRPVINVYTKQYLPCSPHLKCPDGFTCYSNFPDGRHAHCCTTVLTDNDVIRRAPESEIAQFSPPGRRVNNRPKEHFCPQGFIKTENGCRRTFYIGQQGCEFNNQCDAEAQGAFCNRGYCACPQEMIIYQSNCVPLCPEGYANIAGRCHDLTTVVFMDSVEDRANGTIGGYCMSTVVVEEQCIVPNSYCNSRSVTCQCKPGYELKLDEENKSDNLTCIQVADSKFGDSTGPISTTTKSQENSAPSSSTSQPIQEKKIYYVIEFDDPGNSTEIEGSGSFEGLMLNDTSLFMQGDQPWD
uniref:Uncharacterized protein n=1 Tax=Acrobeloides nanus TaxID=290746 RepID=A0A914C1E4_9BILA